MKPKEYGDPYYGIISEHDLDADGEIELDEEGEEIEREEIYFNEDDYEECIESWDIEYRKTRKPELTNKEIEEIKKFLMWILMHKKEMDKEDPTPEIIRTVRKYGWIYTGTVYRSQPSHTIPENVKLGYYVQMIPRRHYWEPYVKKYTSWTTSLKLAELFALSRGASTWADTESHLSRLEYVKKHHKTNVILEAYVKNGINIEKAIGLLDARNEPEITCMIDQIQAFEGGPSELEVVAKVRKAKIIDWFDYTKL